MPLLEQMREHNSFFDELVGLFPAEIYFRDDTNDDSSWRKYKKGDVDKKARERKQQSKAARKQKYQMVDATAEDLIAAKLEREAADIDMDAPKSKAVAKRARATAAAADGEPQRARSAAELREKLKRRLEELRAKRGKKPGEGDDPEERSTGRKRRQRPAGEERQQDKPKRERKPATAVKPATAAKPAAAAQGKARRPSGGGADELLSLDFGEITATSKDKVGRAVAKQVAMAQERKRRRRTGGKGAELESLLEDAAAKERKLRQMAPEEATAARREAGWEAATKRAAGEKVRDDAKRLSKTIKKREQKQRRSKKQWAQRKGAEAAADKQGAGRGGGGGKKGKGGSGGQKRGPGAAAPGKGFGSRPGKMIN